MRFALLKTTPADTGSAASVFELALRSGERHFHASIVGADYREKLCELRILPLWQ